MVNLAFNDKEDLMFKYTIKILLLLLLSYKINAYSSNELIPNSAFSPLESFSNKKNKSTSDRVDYIKELYYSVNGYPPDYDTSMKPQPYLEQFNLALGENGVGGILFSSGYETCDAIPTTGNASGTSTVVGTLNLTFASATKTVPSYYTTDAGKAMDKRISVSGAGDISVDIELKCNDDTSIQTGYVKFTSTQFNVVYEGYFQQNSTTKAINVDMYIKTETGGGSQILIPTQFFTTDGEQFTIFSAYIGLGGGGGGSGNYLVAVQGTANTKAQIAYMNTTDTSGSPVTTSPNNFGSLSSSGGTQVNVECVDIATKTTTTGCPSISAPGSLAIGGTTSMWTVSSLKAVSL